ncbi:uncharacterized protein LOC131665347 [Phymastichus coffea]|uniref:uncharacterized protein LOC131665347 n=1 Tax=Phymastichus coffea TaxID=108790 RepID=UPI00273CE6BB|nr:uncharacterized protein LOC131665347 [Phymastichus coffea]
MLSAKYTRIHGMRNERWTTREKILQYRSILKLHARDKNLQGINGEKFKRKNHRDLKELTKDTSSYREILKDVIFGDKRLLRSIFQTEKDFKILLQDAVPLEAYRAVFQDYNFHRKQLDKLQYLKAKKRKDYCFWQSEYARLSDALEHKDEITKSEEQQLKRQQQLFARYQVALAKRHAAKAISDTYQEILDILKKDSMYFDGVLNALRADQRDQCRVIYKTTLMGQLAIENLDDIRQKYKAIAKDVWINMKEREKDLELARNRAEDVWEYAKSLVRMESDPNLTTKKDTSAEEAKLKQQIENLEKIFDKMKDAMLIRSYKELFTRLEDQVKHRESLSNLYQRSVKERNWIMNKKNHAELVLQNLEHSVVSTTTKYRSEKKGMLDKIKEEKKRLKDNNEMIKSRGELLMNIRVALQSMSSMLICVNPATAKPYGKVKEKRTAKEAREAKEREAKEAEEQLEANSEDDKSKKVCGDTIETEGLAVLTQVSRKANALFMMTNFPMNKAREEKSRNEYADYITECRARMKFGDGDVEQSGIFFEHEAVDPTVPTRAQIKMQSKNLVEAHASKDD